MIPRLRLIQRSDLLRMRTLRPYIVLLSMALFLAAVVPWAEACTTLCVRHGGRIVFGKNYDWNVADGILLVNKRGMEKSSDTREPLRWVARYGSVTFNQYGRDNPMGGMNEAGLVIELMWVDGTSYPAPDARPAVGALAWIQYQLDTAANVAELIASEPRLRITQQSAPLHFLVADRTGAVATIEFVRGKLLAHSGAALPAAALANNFYEDSLRHLQRLDATGQPVTVTYSSLSRFAHAARRTREFSGKDGDPVPYVFATLAQVAQREHTQWSIVYEIDQARVHFRTQRNGQIKTLSLQGLDFSCATPVLLLDLHQNQPGDAGPQLRPYSRAVNLALLRSSFAQTDFLARTPAAEIERDAALPDAGTCRAR